MPACCRRRGEVQDHLHLHQFSARRRRRTCRFSHHFDSFCGGHLLLPCLTCLTFFGFFLCNITKFTQNECFPGLSGKYEAAGNRLIDFDL